MKTKKLFLVIASALLLSGCSPTIDDDDVHGRPDWYNSTLIENLDVKDNNYSKIWDKLIANDASGQYMIDDIFNTVFTKLYGSFDDIEKFAAKAEANLEDGEVKEFTNQHKFYSEEGQFEVKGKWGENQTYEKITDETKLARLRATKLLSLQKYIKESIYEQMFSQANEEGNKNPDGYYEEYRMAEKMLSNMYSLAEKCYKTDSDNIYKLDTSQFYGTDGKTGILITPFDNLKTKDEIYKYYKDNLFHEEYYADFINRNIKPSIMKKLLTQYYTYTNKYATLGRNYSRKVSYISLSITTDTSLFINSLVKNFAADYIEPKDQNNPLHTGDIEWEVLAKAYKGVDLGDVGVDPATDLLDKSIGNNRKVEFTMSDGTTKKIVYEGTKAWQDIFKDLEKILEPVDTDKTKYELNKLQSRQKIDESVLSTYTNSYKDTVEKVINDKLNKLRTENIISRKEWVNKGDSLGSIPSTLTDDLFSIKVATNEVDSLDDYDDGDKTKMLANGHRFLATSKSEKGRDSDSYILTDGLTSYSFIEVHEAISTSKLNDDPESKKSYKYIHAGSDEESILWQEQTSYEVCQNLSDSSNYDKKSQQFFITVLGLIFHDQDIYDYMVNQYPDLFGTTTTD